MLKIAVPINDADEITPAVLQAADMLGLYHAELARILGLKCRDIVDFANANTCLIENTPAWQHAKLFICFYQALYRKHQGNRPVMCNWLRRHEKILGDEPFLMMVDQGKLTVVLEHVLNI